MNMNKIICLALIMAFGLSACSTQTALVNGRSSSSSKDEMQNFFISGLGQTQTINPVSVCGGAENVIKVETVYSPLNWGLSLLTLGIYTPRDSKVYCK